MLMRGVKRADMWGGDEQMLSNGQDPFAKALPLGAGSKLTKKRGFCCGSVLQALVLGSGNFAL